MCQGSSWLSPAEVEEPTQLSGDTFLGRGFGGGAHQASMLL